MAAAAWGESRPVASSSSRAWPKSAELGVGEEALAPADPVFLGRAAGVGRLLNHAPGHGLVDQAGERRDHQVGHGGAVAERVLQIGDMAAPDFGDRALAEGGHDIALDGEPVLGGGGGLAAHRDMLAQVALGEGGKGGARGFLGRSRCGVLAGVHAGDDEGGTAAGLCRADDPVAADGDALRALRGPGSARRRPWRPRDRRGRRSR